MVGYHEAKPLISNAYHEPVLLKEVLEALEVKSGAWYVDATLGDGGHSLEILSLGGNVLGLDVDPEAIKRSGERFKQAGVDQKRFRLVLGNFNNLTAILRQTDPAFGRDQSISGVLFDLGVSSLQLDDPERGFSFSKDGPLDMRMDPNLKVTAADLIKVLRKDELYELFSKLGEERYSKRFAEALASAGQVSTTNHLANIIGKAAGGRFGKVHPATRVFQALRIAVNDELNALKEALPQALDIVDEGGRVAVISFHSLEDRIVKNTFKKWVNDDLGRIVTKKPIVASENEIANNPRSRSGKLRVFEHDNNKKIQTR